MQDPFHLTARNRDSHLLQGEPPGEGGVFLILSPGRSEGSPELPDCVLHIFGGNAKVGGDSGEQLFFADAGHGHSAGFAGASQGVAEDKDVL